MTDQRAAKARYQFHTKRSGDQITVQTAKDRVYVLSAFINWKRDKPGTLSATSKRSGDGYVIQFHGISPAEANEARLAAGDDL
jgi:hypothetical protein